MNYDLLLDDVESLHQVEVALDALTAGPDRYSLALTKAEAIALFAVSARFRDQNPALG